MPSSETLVVADAGPLIALARIGRLGLIGDLFDAAHLPPAVHMECTANASRPGARAIEDAVTQGALSVRAPAESDKLARLHGVLDRGEAEAIQLAAQLGAPLLIDERRGRTAARRMGVRVLGTAGLLLRGKELGHIAAVGPAIEELRQSGYRLAAALVEAILRRAGE